MAIYHLSHGMVSRSTGRSSVQSAAYITGEQLHESRRDIDVNYKNRHSDIAFTNTLAPEHASESFRDTKVWDLLEKFEDEYAIKRFPYNLEAREKYQDSAQTAQTIVMALPRELAVDVAKELVEEFAKERFVSRNLIVTYAIHDDEGNPHAHLQISRRAVNLDGSLAWAKDREICSRKELLATRKLWADLTNNYLMREGYEARISEKSFADLGINLEPSKHRGWVADKLKEKGITSRIVTENIKSFENNREQILENSSVILNEITSKTATFSQIDLLKTIQRRVGDDALLVASAFERALSDAIVVREGLDGSTRYTSESYLQLEHQAIESITKLLHMQKQPEVEKNNRKINLNESKSTEYYMTGISEFLKNNYSYLSQEQSQAVLGLTDDGSQCSVLIGRAGAGKTTTLKAVADIYKSSGYEVIGTSLSAMAADNLERETGIESRTLHSLNLIWNSYKSACDKFLSFDAIVDEGILKQLDWYQDLKKYENCFNRQARSSG
jgi:ATP-dependent exoDNAse (exonuclease V) alpha subunit